jgi:hypothetical protein
VSADPLAIHGLGADPNVYAYVSGQALKSIDPLGLDNESTLSENAAEGGSNSDMCGAQGACASKPGDAPISTPAAADPAPAATGTKSGNGAGGSGAFTATAQEREVIMRNLRGQQWDNLLRYGTGGPLVSGGSVDVGVYDAQQERETASGGTDHQSGSGELPAVPSGARLTLHIGDLDPLVTEAGVPSPTKAITLSMVRELRDFGMDQATRRAFLQGEMVAFEATTATSPIAVMQHGGDRLSAGIFQIAAPGQGVRAFSEFRSASRSIGKSLGAKELELGGIAIRNPDLRASLMRSGFTEGIAPVPEALGGGTVSTVSKVFPIR